MLSESNETKPSGIAGTVDTPAARAPSAAAMAFMLGRKITQPTLDKLGAAFGTAFFPDLGGKREALFFKYPGGWKARAVGEKSFVSSKGFQISFWNIEQVLAANPERIYITEGEADSLALVEAGVPVEQVLSVPNGAKERPAEEPKERRGYRYVEEALSQGLNRVKQIIWCGDSDPAGYSLRSDMVQLFGAARFRFVEWPEGCKDANDLLIHDGREALHSLVTEGSLEWPVEGLYRLSELPEPPAFTLWRPGFSEWESKVMLAPRTLSVVTGHPGHGKTQLWTQIWFQVVRAYCVPICVASFETRPKPHMRRQLRTLFIGKLERDMSDEEKARADAWINERYLFVVHPEQRPALRWFLDMAEIAVVRHGARIVQVDPWNRLEASRSKDETGTEYVGRCLREIYNFAHDMNCHVQIVAHPAKMGSKRIGEPPHLEDISDSKNWDNMVDQGFVVHRPEVFDGTQRKTEANLYCRKSRFEELGYPCKLKMNFDLATGRYKSIDYPEYGSNQLPMEVA